MLRGLRIASILIVAQFIAVFLHGQSGPLVLEGGTLIDGTGLGEDRISVPTSSAQAIKMVRQPHLKECMLQAVNSQSQYSR